MSEIDVTPPVRRPWLRGLPPLWCLLAIAAMMALDRYLPAARWVRAPWNRLGLIFWALGLGLMVWAGRRFWAQGASVHPFHRPTSLVTGGPYRFTRNPMYLGLVAILVGVAVDLGSATPWLVIPLFMALMEILFIRPEEARLEAAFGDEYRRLTGRVRRWL